MRIGDAVVSAVSTAAKPWAQVERKKIRDSTRGERAMERWMRGVRRDPSIKEAAFEVMVEAYEKASGGGQFPVTARQVMYAARPLILAHTEKPLGKDFAAYFTQNLLPAYTRGRPEQTARWDVIYDARGHLSEPHTNRVVSLGTLEVRRYLADARNVTLQNDVFVKPLNLSYPTHGPVNRYKHVLFVEKEGFNGILAAARIADRFDIAIMSTKGYSSTAARSLVEALHGTRMFVLHDFDKDGLGILHTLRHDTERYQFRSPPDVVDLGLRLTDVEAEDLDAEPVSYRRETRRTLRRYGATADELEFLVDRGQRVELNAFTSDRFVVWLERKLTAHGAKKLIPEDAILAAAYRRAVMRQHVNEGLEDLEAKAREVADAVPIPKALAREVKLCLRNKPTLAWDDAVAELADEADTAADREG